MAGGQNNLWTRLREWNRQQEENSHANRHWRGRGGQQSLWERFKQFNEGRNKVAGIGLIIIVFILIGQSINGIFFEAGTGSSDDSGNNTGSSSEPYSDAVIVDESDDGTWIDVEANLNDGEELIPAARTFAQDFEGEGWTTFTLIDSEGNREEFQAHYDEASPLSSLAGFFVHVSANPDESYYIYP